MRVIDTTRGVWNLRPHSFYSVSHNGCHCDWTYKQTLHNFLLSKTTFKFCEWDDATQKKMIKCCVDGNESCSKPNHIQIHKKHSYLVTFIDLSLFNGTLFLKDQHSQQKKKCRSNKTTNISRKWFKPCIIVTLANCNT